MTIVFSKEDKKLIAKIEKLIQENEKKLQTLSPDEKEKVNRLLEYLRKELESTKDYYTVDSDQKITILASNVTGETRERPLQVKGMKRKSKEIEEQLLSRETWPIEDLRKLEGW